MTAKACAAIAAAIEIAALRFGVVPLAGRTFKAVMCADSGCHLKK